MWRHFIKIGISALLIAFLFWRLDVDFHALAHVIQAPLFLILAFAIPFSLMPLFSVNRWRTFLSVIGIRESFLRLWRINYIAQFQGIILPSTQGQDFFRIYHIEKLHPEFRGKAGSTVLVERLFGLFLLLLFCAAALPFAAQGNDLRSCAMILGMICFGVLSVVGFIFSPWCARLCNLRACKYAKLQKILEYIHRFHTSLVDFPYRKVLVSSVCFIAGFQFSTILIVDLLFRACGYDIPFGTHLALFPVICILSMMPITIGGFGVREGFFVYFYTKIGVAASAAFAVSVLDYFVVAMVPALFGGVLWLLTPPTKNN